jgi:hypothetical protein
MLVNDEKDQTQAAPPKLDPKLAGFEAVVAFNWGVNRISNDLLFLNLSHPRHGGMTYAVPAEMAAAVAARIMQALQGDAPTTPASPAPTLQ